MVLTASAAQAEVNRGPYNTAVRCFAAAAYVRHLQTNVGNTAAADALEERAKQAWGVSFILGKAIGISQDEVKRDLDATKDTQLPRFAQDTAYLKSSVAACKAADLM
ncbi:hypothetical protein [Caulobacter sp. DWP3-1-3b2]|uniref:hypothetical protein n=1 Tax=Caulobacter sp. DWP3-1-3b2 TaxID=2804643 RepID=UPI003CE80E1B